MLHGSEPEPDGDPGTAGADQPAGAEGAVTAGHDGAAEAVLDRQRLEGHGHVERPVGETEQGQRNDEGRQAWREQRQRKGREHGQRRDANDDPAADAAGERAGRRQSDQRAGGDGEQRQPENAVRQIERVLYVRNMRDPAADRGAIGEEDAGDRDPGPSHRSDIGQFGRAGHHFVSSVVSPSQSAGGGVSW